MQSVGTPSERRSSKPISSLTSVQESPTGVNRRHTLHLQEARRTVGDLDDVADAVPVAALEAAAVELEPELVADREPDLAALELGHAKPGDTLLVQADVPADDDVVLRLRLLNLFVVVGLDLDERAKNVLVLVGVLVPG